jgi:auxin efflux carrier family
MNLKLIFADFLQKLLALLVLTALAKISSRGRLNWIITGLSLSTLPNTLILGLPLLRAMYGAEAEPLLSQIVGLQSLIWYNLLLFLFELNATKEATVAPSSETTGICVSFINNNDTNTNPKHEQHQMHIDHY